MEVEQRKFGPIPVWLFDSEVSQKSASKEMLEANKANEFVHGFDNAETLIMSIYNFYNENGKNIFAKGFNIDELSMYIVLLIKSISFQRSAHNSLLRIPLLRVKAIIVLYLIFSLFRHFNNVITCSLS